MSHFHLLAAIAVSLITGIWLGRTTLSEQHQTDRLPEYRLATPQPPTQAAREYTQQDVIQLFAPLSERIDAIRSELQTMKTAVREIQASLEQLTTSVQMNATLIEESNTAYNSNKDTYTPDEIAYFQNDIIAQLSDPAFNLEKLHAMPEFEKLSEEDKKPVLEEIARRLDSGEINKRAFLPGYDANISN